MLAREISPIAARLATQYPVLTVTGPRQSGKTTLCQQLFKSKPYVSLEDIETRRYATDDPRGFLAQFPDGAILDEVQKCPDLFSYIQTIVDKKRINGMFILTGSQQFEMLQQLSQSLAGRTAMITLLPFQYSEIFKTHPFKTINDLLFTGFYPRIYDQGLNPTETMRFYVNTYIERDVRQLINIKDMSQFEVFLKLIAGRSGQILNTTTLGNECGTSHNTIKSWISVLEASYILKTVRPYYKNINKRVIKNPKIYFLDTGLLCFLLNIYSVDQLTSHPLRGAVYETFVYSELLKQHYNQSIPDNIYFFRDHQGNEVDFVLEKSNGVDLIEVKTSATFNDKFLAGIHYFEKLYGEQANKIVVYGGEKEHFSYKECVIVNWNGLRNLVKTIK